MSAIDYTDADKYQKDVSRTMRPITVVPTPEQLALVNYALGMAGEAGEAADIVKKHVFHGHALDKEKLVKEIGDVLWYCAATAKTLAVLMSQVMDENNEKLKKRFPDGFSSQDSIARRDVSS